MYLLNNEINCEINTDEIVEKIYNDDNIPKFTFEDFLKYQAIFHPEDKIEFENNFNLQHSKFISRLQGSASSTTREVVYFKKLKLKEKRKRNRKI